MRSLLLRRARFAFSAPILVVLGVRAQCPLPAITMGEPVAALRPNPVTGSVYETMSFDPDGAGPAAPVLLVGGANLTAGALQGQGLVLHDGTQWSTLGGGLPQATVFAMTVFQGELVVAGTNLPFGLGRIARWDGAAWQPLGSGIGPGSVRALATYQGELIAAGAFAAAGGASAGNVARWNGARWAALGSNATAAPGLQGVAQCATVFNGLLHVGGALTAAVQAAGTLPLANLATWNGTSWAAPVACNGAVLSFAVRSGLTAANTFLFMGGAFTAVGTTAAVHVAQQNQQTGAWSGLGTGTPGADCNALAVRSLGSFAFELIACARGAGSASGPVMSWSGANWSTLGSLLASDVTVHGGAPVATGYSGAQRWTGSAFEPLLGPGIAGDVHAAALVDDRPVIAGDFATISAVAVNRIARHDGTGWQPLGAGIGGTRVNVLARARNGDLIAGGLFTTAGGAPAANVARWDGTAWLPLGSGTNGEVLALAVAPGGDVVAGGRFTSAGGTPANRVAVWNGSAWSGLGFGMDQDVRALAVTSSGAVFAGGDFTLAGLQPCAHVAQWNGATWLALGSGTTGPVTAFLERADGALLVGGSFLTAGGIQARGIAVWNGAAWSPLPAGSIGATSIQGFVHLPDGAIAAIGSFDTGDHGVVDLRGGGSRIAGVLPGFATVRAAAVRQNGDLVLGGSFAFVITDGQVPSGQLATVRSACAPSTSVYGSGCIGPVGPVALAAVNRPWIGAIFRAEATGVPDGIAFGLLGLQQVAIPLASLLPEGWPGCDLLATADATTLLLPAGNRAATQLAIPSTMALVGLGLRHQVVPFAISPQGVLTAAVASNGLHLTIGVF